MKYDALAIRKVHTTLVFATVVANDGNFVIAKKIGAPQAVRAVARACATNRIAVAIPCHRVVRSDGGLSGYRGGVERKRALLAKEAKG